MKNIFLFILISVAFFSCSGNDSDSGVNGKRISEKKDSTQVYSEWHLEKDSIGDAKLIKERLDTLNPKIANDEPVDATFTDGYFIYSPDNRFKVMIIRGESCGAYCNPYNFASYYFKSNGTLKMIEPQDYDVHPIDDIYLLKTSGDTSEYLIFGSTWVRPVGYESGTSYNFRHLVVTNETLYFKGVKAFGDHEGEFEYWTGFSIYESGVFCSDLVKEGGVPQPEIGFEYDEEKKTITYVTTVMHDGDEYSCEYVEGEVKYLNGTFTQTKEADITEKLRKKK